VSKKLFTLAVRATLWRKAMVSFHDAVGMRCFPDAKSCAKEPIHPADTVRAWAMSNLETGRT
jgi:hypothetical protein